VNAIAFSGGPELPGIKGQQDQQDQEEQNLPPDKEGLRGVTQKKTYIPYNKNLTEKARENRKNPTPAEKNTANPFYNHITPNVYA
jgi:hypothetical protein